MRNKNLQALVESAILIALAAALSLIALFKMPMGGTVAPFAMAPLVIIGLRWGAKWGLGAGLVYGILQAIQGADNFQWVTGIVAWAGVALLDYLLAFTAYGLAPIVAKPFKTNKAVGWGVGAAVGGLLQFVCSFLSGILLWGTWAPEGTKVWVYSLTYNGSYALPNAVLTVIGTVVAMALLERFFPVKSEDRK
ncbi:MAG: energy-coupled thiamine transporter ThiT [Oscillospiraceae bacterium]|nr:energy-coupled thiamine transporter ThiT [Oscillospiraceae bacterium]